MITSKAIPLCHCSFQGKLLVSYSPKSKGTLIFSSSLRRKSGYGMIAMASVQDPHTTPGVAPGTGKHELKKAYRRLALQYHPDMCKGNKCTIKFQKINFAYTTLLSITTPPQVGKLENDLSDNLEVWFMGVNDDSWEEWEEWMGWEGAGPRDYSNHIHNATSLRAHSLCALMKEENKNLINLST
jgi:hypothetical protein